MAVQEAASAGKVLSATEQTGAGGVTGEERIGRLSGWLTTHLSPEEQQALCRLWMLKGGFQLEAAQAMLGSSDGKAVQAMLRGLVDVSCLQLSAVPAGCSGAARYSMHPVVAEVFRGEFGALPELAQCSILEDWVRLLSTRMEALKALRSAGQWPEANQAMAGELLNLQELRAVLRSGRPCGAALSEDGLKRLVRLGDCVTRLGQHAASAALLHDVTQLASASLGPRHVSTLAAMDGLACALSDAGERAAATATREQVVRLRREVQGDEHAETLASIIAHLASAQQDGGRLGAAAEHHARALQAMQRVHGVEHPDTLIAMGHLGTCLMDMGRFSEAAELLRQALELMLRVLGPLHVQTIACRQNLAVSVCALGEHEQRGAAAGGGGAN